MDQEIAHAVTLLPLPVKEGERITARTLPSLAAAPHKGKRARCRVCMLPEEKRLAAETVIRGEAFDKEGVRISPARWSRENGINPVYVSNHRIDCMGLPSIGRGGLTGAERREFTPKPTELAVYKPEDLPAVFQEGHGRPWILKQLYDAILEINKAIAEDGRPVPAMFATRLEHLKFTMNEVGQGKTPGEKAEEFKRLIGQMNPGGVELKRVTETVTLKREDGEPS